MPCLKSTLVGMEASISSSRKSSATRTSARACTAPIANAVATYVPLMPLPQFWAHIIGIMLVVL